MSHIFLELERTTVVKTLINNIVDIEFLKEKDGHTRDMNVLLWNLKYQMTKCQSQKCFGTIKIQIELSKCLI